MLVYMRDCKLDNISFLMLYLSYTCIQNYFIAKESQHQAAHLDYFLDKGDGEEWSVASAGLPGGDKTIDTLG